jgi:hypothetical protein
MERAKDFLRNIFGREGGTALTRRDALTGLGLAGLLLAAPKLSATPADAKALEPARTDSQPAKTESPEENEHLQQAALEDGDGLTDLSSRRHWRHRRWYWRRRRWWHRRRWWRRRWHRRRWWRRRWRRRYW